MNGLLVGYLQADITPSGGSWVVVGSNVVKACEALTDLGQFKWITEKQGDAVPTCSGSSVGVQFPASGKCGVTNPGLLFVRGFVAWGKPFYLDWSWSGSGNCNPLLGGANGTVNAVGGGTSQAILTKALIDWDPRCNAVSSEFTKEGPDRSDPLCSCPCVATVSVSFDPGYEYEIREKDGGGAEDPPFEYGRPLTEITCTLTIVEEGGP
jgi:hypothetical protein